ncbi:tetratricopeptide repeat protein [Fibrella sp. HMF5335]|uniref:histidine kinase n=1 Tax=Fibrella rubiginis TaxID=2817060 RepID=A0A939GEU2_9BACT|nr:histidine kinase dimerization/phosphoacceptor domain -containing protein [Fibrella rubiginis]MBO0937036.1 tetratricopeptide repeat protein [Fibrella rubiginis]
MIRSTLIVCLGILLWLLTSTVGLTQAPIHLKLRPERLAKARALEQKAIREKDSLQLAEAWYLFGKTYVFAGDLPTAQAYFLKALHVHEPRGASFELSRLYVRLSETENKLGRFDEALTYAKRAMLVAQQSRSDKDRALVRAYGNMALLYQDHWAGQLRTDTTKFAQVLTYFRQAEAFCYKLNDTLGIAECNMNIGALLVKRLDKQAIVYLKEALRLFALKHKEGIRVNAMLQLAGAYVTFGKPALAYQALQQAEQFYISHKLNEYDLRLGLETSFVNYYTATGQWQAAFDRLKRQHELERSQILADRDGAISRLNIEYDTEKKEALLATQKRELGLRATNLRTQQWLTLAMVGLLLMAIGLLATFFRLNQKNERISRQNAELVKEQNHRVKNNLQVVSSLLSLQASRLTDEAAKQAVEESQLRVQSMAILHRRLYDGEQLALVDLDEFIRELVNGVLITFGCQSASVRFSIDTIYLSADKATPLGLIMNELTTNACKYAFPGNANPQLWIHCRRKGRLVLLDVADNGPGLTEVDVSQLQTDNLLVAKKRTFGLMLIEAQVTQLNGRGHFDSGGKGLGQGTVFSLEFNA